MIVIEIYESQRIFDRKLLLPKHKQKYIFTNLYEYMKETCHTLSDSI